MVHMLTNDGDLEASGCRRRVECEEVRCLCPTVHNTELQRVWITSDVACEQPVRDDKEPM
jgi:hypothetical protein